MMMGQTVTYLIAAVICTTFLMSPVYGATTEKDSLNQLIEENRNMAMDANEMAFLLATHGYDAVPKDDYVMVCVDGETLKIAP